MSGAISVLWSGGWDSTFRVLELVLLERARVEPYYIVDPKRRSGDREREAMAHIRERLFARCSQARDLLLPLVVVSRDDLPPDPEITRSLESLGSRMWVGSQYEWLGRFARARGLHDLELCMEGDRGGNGPLKQLIDSQLVGTGHARRLREPIDPELVAFRFLRFPILHLTKADMKTIAKAHGFLDLLYDTWFCHKPVRGRPCGKCSPCLVVMREGFAERMPASSIARHYWWKIRRTIRPSRRKLAFTPRNHSAA